MRNILRHLWDKRWKYMVLIDCLVGLYLIYRTAVVLALIIPFFLTEISGYFTEREKKKKAIMTCKICGSINFEEEVVTITSGQAWGFIIAFILSIPVTWGVIVCFLTLINIFFKNYH